MSHRLAIATKCVCTVHADTIINIHYIFTHKVVQPVRYYVQDLKNIKNVKGCRDGMPKSKQTR